MSIIVIIAMASLLIAGIFLGGLIWSIKDGQYEDDYAPPNRILFDENNTKKITKAHGVRKI